MYRIILISDNYNKANHYISDVLINQSPKCQLLMHKNIKSIKQYNFEKFIKFFELTFYKSLIKFIFIKC